MTTPKSETINYRTRTGWFGTVDDFIDPLIKYFQPVGGKTVRQQYDSINSGRIVGWLNMIYGRENIQKFINICDMYGFDKTIEDIYVKNIKTLGRFRDYLDNK